MRSLILAGLIFAAPAFAAPALADPAQHLDRGNAWRALDEFYAALTAYDTGLREAPGSADLLAERALTLHRLGQLGTAETVLAQAIANAAPRDGAPYTARAGLALLARQDAVAAVDLAEALRRTPDDARAQALLTLLNARRGAGPAPDPRVMDRLRHSFGPWLGE